MGVSDESAILSKWLVREGDPIHKGQPVFSLETDKATFQYEAESDGYLVRILTGEGEEVAVGSPVGVISDSETIEESELEALTNEPGKPAGEQLDHTKENVDIPQGENQAFTAEHVPVQNEQGAKQKVSPRARKTAGELGVDLNAVCSGSGPGGRILERDILKTVQGRQASEVPEPKTDGIYPGRPLTIADRSSIRQACADKAGQTGFVSRAFDARDILAACTPRNKLTPGVVVCHELAGLLARTPELNARRHGDRIYGYDTVHLRSNAETSFGLMKPVIRCAEAYTAEELAVLMRNAVERCKRFESKPQEFQEGTFSVADLSGYGVDFFTPELTPPELCALGIGAATMQTKAGERGGIEAYPAIRLTLAYDRAGIDPLRAARFLDELALLLEQRRTKQQNN